MLNEDELEEMEYDEIDEWIAGAKIPRKKVKFLTIGIVGLFIASFVIVFIIQREINEPSFVDSDNDGVEDSEDVLPDADAWVKFQVWWSCECEIDVMLTYEPLNFNESSLLLRSMVRNDTGMEESRLADWPDEDEYLNMSVILHGMDQYDFSIYYWGAWDMPNNSIELDYTVTVIR